VSESQAMDESKRVYRVDKFVVPAGAREEFLGRVRQTHELLRAQPGFIQDFLLEQTAGPGEFNFVTMVEWEGAEAVEKARAAVMARHREMGFDPQELRARLGIRADVADYRRVDS
jgi:heme-degrading monooxygenase HmoA